MKCLRAYELSWHDSVRVDLHDGFEIVCGINDGGTPVLLVMDDDERPLLRRRVGISMGAMFGLCERIATVPRVIEGAGMGRVIGTYFVWKEVR